MSEMSPEMPNSWTSNELIDDRPLDEMTHEEYVAWYLEYMQSVPEDNIMLVSGLPMEIHDNPEAFNDFVTVFQQLKRQGMV